MHMRVLLVDDDEHIQEFLVSGLLEKGFAVDAAGTGERGIHLGTNNDYDLVLLDLNLPDMGGEDVIEALHKKTHVPRILLLTVTTSAWSKVRLLEAGADDYLEKPFLFEELVARMHALLRRAQDLIPNVLIVGDIILNVSAQSVLRDKHPITLTPKEFGLLEYLLRNRGSVVSKSELIEHVWDSSADPFSSSVDTHMTNLRQKLGTPDIIKTIHSRGYTVE